MFLSCCLFIYCILKFSLVMSCEFSIMWLASGGFAPRPPPGLCPWTPLGGLFHIPFMKILDPPLYLPPSTTGSWKVNASFFIVVKRLYIISVLILYCRGCGIFRNLKRGVYFHFRCTFSEVWKIFFTLNISTKKFHLQRGALRLGPLWSEKFSVLIFNVKNYAKFGRRAP